MTLGDIAVAVGYIVAAAGWVWGLVVAFRDSRVTGFACLFVPLLLAYFLSTRPRRGWGPFLTIVAGVAVMLWGLKEWKAGG